MSSPQVGRSPFEQFITHNEELVQAMVQCPIIAKAARALVEGVFLWAEDRGLMVEDVDVSWFLGREGALVFRFSTAGEEEEK